MSDLPRLLPHHQHMLLEESAIGAEVARERGYYSATTKSQLRDIGYGPAQQQVPTLVIPVYSPAGEQTTYQHRPDNPRAKKGKLVKYETLPAERMHLDVPRRARQAIRDPGVPLLITEGVKKADSAVSRGLCCVALLGVWNFTGANEQGGKTLLAEWFDIALNGRQVYIVYDSDVMLKPQVHGALARLKAILEKREAKVAVIYLPPGEGGKKQGMDDFFAAGHGPEDLLARATSELRQPARQEPPTGAAQILWENEPERITRPLMLLSRDSVAVVSLPVGIPEQDGDEVRSVDQLHLVTGGGELLSEQQARERGWQLEVGDATPARWSKAGVRRYLDGHRPEAGELLNELASAFSYYIAFETVAPLTQQTMARLLSIKVMASYFTPAFPAIPYAHFHGGKGSGKSKAQELDAVLSFNGVWVIATTTTAAIRRVAASGGLIAIDDTENLSPRDDPERYSLLLSGYRAGAVFQLVEDDGHGVKRVRNIPVYGMRTFSSIKELDDTLRSRCIPLPLVRSCGPQANRSPGIGYQPCRAFASLCDDALAFSLPRLGEASRLYARLAQKEVLSGRDMDVAGPLLTVAYLMGGLALYQETLSTLRVLLCLREDQGDEAREVPVLRALLRLLGAVTHPVELSARTVSDWIEQNDAENAHYTDASGSERSRYTSWTVGKILRQLQIGRCRRSGKGRWTEVDPVLLAKRVEAFGGRAHVLGEESPEEVSHVSATTPA